jgi:hypothetical protein
MVIAVWFSHHTAFPQMVTCFVFKLILLRKFYLGFPEKKKKYISRTLGGRPLIEMKEYILKCMA